MAHQEQISNDSAIILNLNGLNYVKFTYNDEQLFFLLDSGASVSVIFKKFISTHEIVDFSNRVKINGISGSTISQGSANITLKFNNADIVHKFLLMDAFENGIHGVIGADFFYKFQAFIDYEKFIFSFFVNDTQISLPIECKYDFYTTIPARCEVIKYCWVDENEECLVLPDELCEGVFVAAIMTKPISNMIPVRILNTRSEDVKLKNFKPKTSNLNNFETCEFSDNAISVDRLDKIFKLINTNHLNQEENYSLQRVCAKYADVFHLEEDPLTVTNIYEQAITLQKSATPAYIKPYRLPHAQKAEVHKQVQKMLQDGIIEEARSEWSAPLLIVPKKADSNGNKKWRVVIDYRQLNKRIEDDKFPLPCITDILDSLSGAVYFSHLDLSQSYYQIGLEAKSRHCTAFTTDRGQYQMTRLPMGLKISPSSFSRAMTIAMTGLNYDSCFIYLDDLIVFGNNLINHNKNLTKVLQRLKDVNLKLNPSKCNFLRKEILYLGHIIASERVSPDPEKTKVIQNYPIPKDANETKRFVAFANYYRKYIPNFANIAAPLNNLSRKNVNFNWTTECQNSFIQLKDALIHPPILQYPDFSPDNEFILRTDASGYAVGAVLSNGNDKPVAYASRSLNVAEKRYSTIEKELTAIVFAVKHFRPYLFGRKFLILTDHRPLVYLFGMSNPSSRLTKFRLTLEEYDFTIQYVKGRDNVTADALSRIEITSDQLKAMRDNVDETIYVQTRAQTKNLNKNNSDDKQAGKDIPHKRLDHPGVVEILKPAENSVELSVIADKKYCEIINGNNYDYKIGNFACVRAENKIYMKQDTRSAFALTASLRDLKNICIKYKIPEIYILKNKACMQIINEVSKVPNEIKNAGIKISIIKDVKKIDDSETREIIINDFHILPTGGHAIGVKLAAALQQPKCEVGSQLQQPKCEVSSLF